MSKLKLTPQQQTAVSVSGNALLVSAAAGSGKTMVLVQRLMDKICDPEINADITDFLVITYTRAAASELKTRVLKEINRRISDEPQNRHLRRQAVLGMKAHISTIHGFCADLLRENAHILDISPDFRVADETECAIIKEAVLEKVLNEKYDNIENDPDFTAFTQLLIETRGDRKLTEAVLDAYTKLQSHPNHDEWMNIQEKQLDLKNVTDLSETVWGREIIKYAIDVSGHCLYRMKNAYAEMQAYPDMLKAYGDSFCVTIKSIEDFIKALETGWDAAYEKKDILFPTARVKGYDDLKKVRSDCKKILENTSKLFDGCSTELLDDMKSVAKETRGLYGVLRAFEAEYTAEKRRRGIVDFSDQEHLALKLLYDFENGCPTDIARTVSTRFREVMVDEYQDVNAVQEQIFSSVSQNGKNLFMVGDVKQSIYRFRMADPTIFLGKYLSFSDYDGDTEKPFKVIFQSNFRSEKGILDAVNYIFSNLMSEKFGEMDYTKKEFLNPGADYPESDESPVEYDILEVNGDDAPDKIQAEAEFIASRIRELVENGTVIWDKGEYRPLKYDDFTILLRSLKNRAWQYAAALEALGIPVDLPKDASFFESYEISLMMSFMAVIDNPRQDIPLVAVLTSPLFRFTPDELAEIRTENRNATIFDALVKRSENEKKCADFVAVLNDFRFLAAELSADKLIWHIYNSTGLIELLNASQGGEDRRNNLIILTEYARKFEENGYKGLFRFVNYLKAMAEKGGKADNDVSGSSGVKIMTIHKSKGLEFPIVILADTTHKFNLQDVTKPILFHQELGTGLYKRDRKRRIKYPTVARLAVSKKIVSESLAEELRVLYVALTRAKNRLIMVTSVADAEKEIAKYHLGGEYPTPPVLLEGVRSYAGWLLYTALQRPESIEIFKPEVPIYNITGDTPWNMRIVKYAPAEPVKKIGGDNVTVIKPNADIVKELTEKLSYVYPFESSVALPSKMTATELKGRVLDREIAEDAQNMVKPVKKLRRPVFETKEKPLTGSERGTALHQTMQYINYGCCTDIEGIQNELARLVDDRFITAQQAACVDPQKILRFFKSDVGRKIQSSLNVKREFKFSLLVPANKLTESDACDKILFQGVIDCFYEDEEGINVIDFKTDYITEENFGDKISQYSAQVSSYIAAIGRITGKKTAKAYLYFFSNEQLVEISQEKGNKTVAF